MENKENAPFWLKSYENHSAHERAYDSTKLETWKRFDTVDAWRHQRMYDSVLPLIRAYPESKWITVGDGRYGSDANYLIRNKVAKVLATSISDGLLIKATEDGFINEYKMENAEKLSFENDSFDFAFCKESYHHFPRPMLAVYEMLRVAEKGIIIIEPNDENIIIKNSKNLITPKKPMQLTKDFIKDLGGIKRYEYNYILKPQYEKVGNYIYSVSEREFEKVALALNYPVIAFKGLNDFYEEGVEFEKADPSSELFMKVKNSIDALDRKCQHEGKSYNILVTIIFKVIPGNKTLIELEKKGFTIKKLDRNPYISS